MLKAECVDRLDLIACAFAQDFCYKETMTPYYQTKRNPYDISKLCVGDFTCYPIAANISAYLNLPSIREKLGLDSSAPQHEPFSIDVGNRFINTGDDFHDTSLYVAGLLERGIKILIYAGDYDWICNWIGNLKWTEEMEWTGQGAYLATTLEPWTVDVEPAGVTRGAKGLTFATVHGAGHMVPYDKPVQALAMLNRWLSESELYDRHH